MDIHIITGHLGSGKTEVAVNLALQMAGGRVQTANAATVALVDVDVVNPYFAAREARAILEARGVKVAAPSLRTTTADVPALPKDVYKMLHREDHAVIIDVGGDPAGARVLGSLYEHLKGKQLHVYCVVNTKRPFTRSTQDIHAYIEQISAASRLPMTGLIHNTHLLHETSVQDVCDGQQVLEQVAKEKELPIVFTAAMKQVAEELEGYIDNDVLPMEQYMKPPYVL